jgi:hypothetical protein
MPDDATPPSCHASPSACQPPSTEAGKAPFLCAPYLAGGDGRYQPSDAIDRCPFAAAGEPCKICKHGFRERKTGPEIPLRVLRCEPHGRYFTVYPPGYMPYGRCSVAVVDLRGEPVERSDPEPAASCRGCLFEAPLDAAADQVWENEPVVELHRPRYPTQRRRLRRCGQLLGLDRALSNVVVEQIRDHLGLDGLDHEQARQQFQQAKSLAPQAEAILTAHQRSAPRGRVLRLLAAGSLSGLWGHPWLWDASRGQLFSLLGRSIRTLRAPP